MLIKVHCASCLGLVWVSWVGWHHVTSLHCVCVAHDVCIILRSSLVFLVFLLYDDGKKGYHSHFYHNKNKGLLQYDIHRIYGPHVEFSGLVKISIGQLKEFMNLNLWWPIWRNGSLKIQRPHIKMNQRTNSSSGITIYWEYRLDSATKGYQHSPCQYHNNTSVQDHQMSLPLMLVESGHFPPYQIWSKSWRAQNLSTGRLIAIMLGHLCMTIDGAIEHYCSIWIWCYKL